MSSRKQNATASASYDAISTWISNVVHETHLDLFYAAGSVNENGAFSPLEKLNANVSRVSLAVNGNAIVSVDDTDRLFFSRLLHSCPFFGDFDFVCARGLSRSFLLDFVQALSFL